MNNMDMYNEFIDSGLIDFSDESDFYDLEDEQKNMFISIYMDNQDYQFSEITHEFCVRMNEVYEKAKYVAIQAYKESFEHDRDLFGCDDLMFGDV